MEVIPRRHGCIFIADEARERAGIIIALDRLDMLGPGGGDCFPSNCWIGQYLWQGVLRIADNQLARGAGRLLIAFIHHLMPAPNGGVDNEFGIPVRDTPTNANDLAMIGDHEKIERTRQLRVETGRRSHFIASRKAERVLSGKPDAVKYGIDAV